MKKAKKLLILLLALVMVLSMPVTAFADGAVQNVQEGPDPFENMFEMNEDGSFKLDADDNKIPLKNGNGTISISGEKNGAIPNEEYSLYQILYLESYSTGNAKPGEDGNITGGKYAYKLNSAWTGFLDYEYSIEYVDETGVAQTKTGIVGMNILNVDDQGYVTWVGEDTRERAALFAKLALEYAKGHGEVGDADYQPPRILPIETKKADPVPKKDGSGNVLKDENGHTIYNERSSVTFDNLKLGYYLIDTTLGSLCALDTTNPTVYMQEKNSVPTNTKTVKEGGVYGPKNDVNIGDLVNFRSVVSISSGLDQLTYHDKMDAGLTFVPGSIEIIYDATDTKQLTKGDTLIEGTHYRIVEDPTVPGGTTAEGCTFHIEFLDEFFKGITTGDHTLTITYNATLNENAVVGQTGNKNDSYVDYGDLHNTTPHSETVTRTWEVPILKYYLTGEAQDVETPLNGAVFKLSLDATETKDTPAAPIKFVEIAGGVNVPVKNADGTIKKDESGKDVTENWPAYRIATQEEIEAAAQPGATTKIVEEITTDNNGKFRLQGLDGGTTYYLYETKAPGGFNKLDAPIPVQIDHDGAIKQNETSVTLIKVKNGSGTEMPSTGGIGTTIFYVAGSVLLLSAVVLLVTKKRMSAEK